MLRQGKPRGEGYRIKARCASELAAFFGTLDCLSDDKRMHNADTYAIYAFENAFGRQRLKALFPLLK